MLWHRQRDPVQLVVQENRVVPTTSSRRAGAGGKGATVRAGRMLQNLKSQSPPEAKWECGAGVKSPRL